MACLHFPQGQLYISCFHVLFSTFESSSVIDPSKSTFPGRNSAYIKIEMTLEMEKSIDRDNVFRELYVRTVYSWAAEVGTALRMNKLLL